jgi:hypothetical protein
MKLNSYLAVVAIEASHSLEETAQMLNEILKGFLLSEDQSGRFEEIPAYADQKLDIELQLFGIPEEEEGDHYILRVRSINDIDPTLAGAGIGSDLIESFPQNAEPAQNGYVNVSSLVLGYLNSRTSLRCWLP